MLRISNFAPFLCSLLYPPIEPARRPGRPRARAEFVYGINSWLLLNKSLTIRMMRSLFYKNTQKKLVSKKGVLIILTAAVLPTLVQAQSLVVNKSHRQNYSLERVDTRPSPLVILTANQAQSGVVNKPHKQVYLPMRAASNRGALVTLMATKAQSRAVNNPHKRIMSVSPPMRAGTAIGKILNGAPAPAAPSSGAKQLGATPKPQLLKCELIGDCSAFEAGAAGARQACPEGLGVSDVSYKVGLNIINHKIVVTSSDITTLALLGMSCDNKKCTGSGKDAYENWI